MRFKFVPVDGADRIHEWAWGGLSAAAVLGARLLPFDSMPALPCMFRELTGYPCMSCGMTRAFRYMAHAQPATAWRYSPLGCAVFVVALLWASYSALVLCARLPVLRVELTRSWESRALRLFLLSLVVANWIWIVPVHKQTPCWRRKSASTMARNSASPGGAGDEDSRDAAPAKGGGGRRFH